MHSDCGGGKGVVWGKDQGAPVLTVVVWSIWGSGEDVVPSREEVVSWLEGRGRRGWTYSRMLDSEGWAMMYGGGFSEIVLYSRVNCFLSVSPSFFRGQKNVPACWQLDWPSCSRGRGYNDYQSV